MEEEKKELNEEKEKEEEKEEKEVEIEEKEVEIEEIEVEMEEWIFSWKNLFAKRYQAIYLQKMGENCIKERNYLKAISAFNLAIQLNKNNFFLYEKISFCYFQLGNFDESLNFAKILIEKNEKNFIHYFNIGKIFKKIGKFENAIENFKRAIELNRENISSYSQLGECFRSIKKYDKVIKLYEKAIEINKNEFQFHFLLAEIFDEISNFDRSIEEYKKGFKYNNGYEEELIKFSSTLIKAKKIADAINQYEKLILIDQSNLNYYFLLGEILFINSQYRLSIDQFYYIKNEFSRDPFYYSDRFRSQFERANWLIVLNLIKLKEYKKAKNFISEFSINQFLNDEKNNFLYRYLIAIIYYKNNDLKISFDHFNYLIYHFSDQIQKIDQFYLKYLKLNFYYAMILIKLNKKNDQEKIIFYLNKSIDQNENRNKSFFRRGNFYSKNIKKGNNLNLVKSDYQSAIDLNIESDPFDRLSPQKINQINFSLNSLAEE